MGGGPDGMMSMGGGAFPGGMGGGFPGGMGGAFPGGLPGGLPGRSGDYFFRNNAPGMGKRERERIRET